MLRFRMKWHVSCCVQRLGSRECGGEGRSSTERSGVVVRSSHRALSFTDHAVDQLAGTHWNTHYCRHPRMHLLAPAPALAATIHPHVSLSVRLPLYSCVVTRNRWSPIMASRCTTSSARARSKSSPSQLISRSARGPGCSHSWHRQDAGGRRVNPGYRERSLRMHGSPAL